MSWRGKPPRLDRVPAIWPPDADQLMSCGVETVDDLIAHVRSRGGFSGLSERSTVPVPQLRLYFRLAEKASSKARARHRGALVLIGVALLTAVLAFVTKPVPMTPEEEKYAELHQRYVENDDDLAGELDSIVALYEIARNGDSTSASAARARLDSLVGGEAVSDDGTMSPQLASVLSLRAAMHHDAAVRAVERGDLTQYDSLFRESQKLDALLGETESHREYAVENSQRAMTERAQVFSWLRPTLGPDEAAHLLESNRALIGAEIAALDSAVRLLDGRLESQRQRDSLRMARTDSVQEAADRRLDSVDLSVDSIRMKLLEHTEKLDRLIALMEARPLVDSLDTSAPPIREERLANGSRPTFVNEAEARRIIAAAWPRELRAAGIGGTVGIEVIVDEEGAARDPKVVTSSGYEQLDAAALTAIAEIRWNPARAASGRPIRVLVTRPITFEPSR